MDQHHYAKNTLFYMPRSQLMSALCVHAVVHAHIFHHPLLEFVMAQASEIYDSFSLVGMFVFFPSGANAAGLASRSFRVFPPSGTSSLGATCPDKLLISCAR
ncbi:hypothetical protein CPB85DRAFT_861262 [Mucidula mucida]|nr:hypothetical protein CPB85DRAFT_861262 [Mucidula mucida]